MSERFEVVEHERTMIFSSPDSSTIVQDRYRRDSMAPWIIGMCEVYCGQCEDKVAEADNAADARIALLDHELQHVKEEMTSMRVALHKLGHNGT